MILTQEPEAPVSFRHPSSAAFHRLLTEIGELHDKKQADYGTKADPFANVRATEEWGIPAWAGAMIRANDKIQRMKSMLTNGKVENESIEDSFLDIAVYSLIGLVLYREQGSQGPFTDVAVVEEMIKLAEERLENDQADEAYMQCRYVETGTLGKYPASEARDAGPEPGPDDEAAEAYRQTYDLPGGQQVAKEGDLVMVNEGYDDRFYTFKLGIIERYIGPMVTWPYGVRITEDKVLWLARHEFEVLYSV